MASQEGRVGGRVGGGALSETEEPKIQGRDGEGGLGALCIELSSLCLNQVVSWPGLSPHFHPLRLPGVQGLAWHSSLLAPLQALAGPLSLPFHRSHHHLSRKRPWGYSDSQRTLSAPPLPLRAVRKGQPFLKQGEQSWGQGKQAQTSKNGHLVVGGWEGVGTRAAQTSRLGLQPDCWHSPNK